VTNKVALSLKNVACVHVINQYRNFAIDRKKITQIVTEISRRLGVAQYEICVQFVSPRRMRSLNKTYRQQDKSTDVLSFPQCEWKRPLKVKKSLAPEVKILNPMPLGDVVISAHDARLNSISCGHDLAQEVCFLMIHGILHLVGHDHMKAREKIRMFTEQKKLMRIFAGGKSRKPQWNDCIRQVKTRPAISKNNTNSGNQRRSKRNTK